VKRLVLAIALLPALAVPASAQGTQGTLGAGLSFVNWPDFTTLPGFTVDYSSPVRTMTNASIGWVGDLSWHRKGEVEEFGEIDQSLLLLQGGVRVTGITNPKFRPFGQVLLGMVRDTCCEDFSETAFALTPGGGIDLGINDKAGVRVQVDFPIAMFEGESETLFRFWFGVSWRMGQ
jgi:hypothetical protein